MEVVLNKTGIHLDVLVIAKCTQLLLVAPEQRVEQMALQAVVERREQQMVELLEVRQVLERLIPIQTIPRILSIKTGVFNTLW